MSEAPERIWAGKYRSTWWQSSPHHQMTEYVRADLVQSQIDAAVAAEREACAELLGHLFPLGSDEDITCDVAAAAIRARGKTDALAKRDARIRAEARRVKPLEWEYYPAGAIAAPPTGHAYIIDTIMKGRVYSLKGFNLQREFASMNEAKAAAQADYERRILPALIPDDA